MDRGKKEETKTGNNVTPKQNQKKKPQKQEYALLYLQKD